jgi:hypothetical protein
MPQRISGQYRNVSEPGEDLANIKVEVHDGVCLIGACRPLFSLYTDDQGRFEVETLVDTTALTLCLLT